MGIHTKIVEFMGPAACGKSSLCNLLRDRFLKENVSVATWTDLTRTFKQQHFFTKIRCVSLLRFFLYLKMYRLAKPEKIWRRYLFLYFIKIDILYTYAKKFSNYTFVFVEHGILQNIISTQTQVVIADEKKFLLELIFLLERINSVDFCICCDIDVEEALSRMKKRNRINEGRIDKEKNIEKKRLLLQRDADNCCALFECLKLCKRNRILKKLDVRNDLDVLYRELLPAFTVEK